MNLGKALMGGEEGDSDQREMRADRNKGFNNKYKLLFGLTC